MDNSYYIRNTSSKFIEISGDDRTSFLQGLITNDINKCQNTKNSIYSCLLSPQGKFIADFFIINLKHYYLIEINEKFFESFCSKLKIYKLRSKIDIIENTNLLSLIFFSKEPSPFKKNIISFNDPRKDSLGIKIYLDKFSNDLKLIENLKEYKYKKYEEILIKNLVPNSANDLIENKSLMLENNFQNLNAIDWNKGCYIGQELTARMKYRALLKKKIYVLKLLSGNVDLEEDIIENGINFGKIISKIDKYLLCMLKINLAEGKFNNKEEIEINFETKIKFL